MSESVVDRTVAAFLLIIEMQFHGGRTLEEEEKKEEEEEG